MIAFGLILLTCLAAAHLTYFLSHEKKMGPVRASSLATLAFIAFTFWIPFALIPKLQAAFFGASFVGMSDTSRLNEKQIVLASMIFSVCFYAISHFKVGLGGTLGATAFAACLMVSLLPALKS
jgi:hypothetical protein